MTITRILLTSFAAGLAMGAALVVWPDTQGVSSSPAPGMHYAPGRPEGPRYPLDTMPGAESPYNCLIYVDNVWLECRAIYRIRDA